MRNHSERTIAQGRIVLVLCISSFLFGCVSAETRWKEETANLEWTPCVSTNGLAVRAAVSGRLLHPKGFMTVYLEFQNVSDQGFVLRFRDCMMLIKDTNGTFCAIQDRRVCHLPERPGEFTLLGPGEVGRETTGAYLEATTNGISDRLLHPPGRPPFLIEAGNDYDVILIFDGVAPPFFVEYRDDGVKTTPWAQVFRNPPWEGEIYLPAQRFRVEGTERHSGAHLSDALKNEPD